MTDVLPTPDEVMGMLRGVVDPDRGEPVRSVGSDPKCGASRRSRYLRRRHPPLQYGRLKVGVNSGGEHGSFVSVGYTADGGELVGDSGQTVGYLVIHQIEARRELVRTQGLGVLLAFRDAYTDLAANEAANEAFREGIRDIVGDPATAETLCPTTYGLGCKRQVLDRDYYDTFNRDNVTLVDVHAAPIETSATTAGRKSETAGRRSRPARARAPKRSATSLTRRAGSCRLPGRRAV